MGLGDNLIAGELKKTREQTNDRLDAILAELRYGNQLLAQLAGIPAPPPLAPPADTAWLETEPANGRARHSRRR